jgi:hypothetical protein
MTLSVAAEISFAISFPTGHSQTTSTNTNPKIKENPMPLYFLTLPHDTAEEPTMGSMQDLDPAELEKVTAAVEQFNNDLVAADALVTAGGLHPPSTAITVDATGEAPTHTQAPFVEATEYVGGFWIINAHNEAAALTWAEQASAALGSRIEVRALQEEPPWTRQWITITPSKSWQSGQKPGRMSVPSFSPDPPLPEQSMGFPIAISKCTTNVPALVANESWWSELRSVLAVERFQDGQGNPTRLAQQDRLPCAAGPIDLLSRGTGSTSKTDRDSSLLLTGAA